MLLAETPLTRSKIAKRPQEVDLTEVGPQRFHEVELAVRALPQHEVAEPLLARGADDEVGIGLPARVQVLADEVGGEDLRESVEGSARVGVLAHDAAHRIRDLPAPAVAHRKIDVEASIVGGSRTRRGENILELARQTGEVADVLDPPIAIPGEVVGEFRDYLEEVAQFGVVSSPQVVSGEQVQGRHFDVEVVAPVQKLAKLRGTGPVPVARGLERARPRPTPVSVKDDRHVARAHGTLQFAPEAALVQPVKKAQTPRSNHTTHTHTLSHAERAVHSGGTLRCPRVLRVSNELPNIPVLEDSVEFTRGTVPDEAKPTWRGWIHAGTFPVAIVLGVVLLVLADGAVAKWSSAVFMASSLLLFGMSALYHRLNWKERARTLLKRIDHANIFLLIAGSYTPITVLCLPPDKATILLVLVWGGALVGIGFRVFWIGAPRWLYVPLYVLLGWAAIMFIVDFFNANWVTMTLILVGGAFYTLGAVVYGLKRPNPFPGTFGFHEIFHTFTLFAFLCHWVGIFLVAIDPPLT